MSADALTQIKEWLADEIENRKLLLSTMQSTHADSVVLKEKQDTLSSYEQAAGSAGSEASFEAFLTSHTGSDKIAAIAKMWAGLKA